MDTLTLGKKIGEGNFGVVYEGTMINNLLQFERKKVAIKIPKHNFGLESFLSTVSELKTMKIVGKHGNLVELLGVVRLREIHGKFFHSV